MLDAGANEYAGVVLPLRLYNYHDWLSVLGYTMSIYVLDMGHRKEHMDIAMNVFIFFQSSLVWLRLRFKLNTK